MTEENSFKTRIEQAKQRAKAVDLEKQRAAVEQKELIDIIEDIVGQLEKNSEGGFKSTKVDLHLPLKGHPKDFEYRPGCAPGFIFQPGSFTDKLMFILRNDLGLNVKPEVYRDVDYMSYNHDVTYHCWLSISL